MSRGRGALLGCLALVLWLAMGGRAAAGPGKRVALVVGNGAYQRQGQLKSPAVDARAMGERLRQLGFDVELAVDQDLRGMNAAAQRFEKKLRDAELGLLFYSGHGIQVADANYLIPVDAELREEDDARYQAVDLQPLVNSIQRRARVGVVILDACRDNPFVSRMNSRGKSVAKGVILVQPQEGDIAILYATSPGEKALDGGGGRSPFTEALLEQISQPGVSLQTALTRVVRRVKEVTKGKQRPVSNISLSDEVYLASAAVAAPPAPKVEPPVPTCPPGTTLEGGRCVPLALPAQDAPEQLSVDVIKAVLKSVKASVNGCGPGTYAVKLTIGRNGRISDAFVPGKAGDSAADCVVRVVKGARFPEFTGEPQTLTYPFVVQ